MFKENDILYTVYGYGCKLVSFYKVIRTTKTMVVLQEMKQEIVTHDGYGQAGTVIPTEIDPKSEIIRRKVAKSSMGNDYVKVADYEYAYGWDGKPVSFDTYD